MNNTIFKLIIIGVDTHKAKHVAVAIDRQGAKLATLSVLSHKPTRVADHHICS